MTDPPGAARVAAAFLILLNVDVVLSVLLTAGYELPVAIAAVTALGTVTAEIVARLFPGDDSGVPPMPPPMLSWRQ